MIDIKRYSETVKTEGPTVFYKDEALAAMRNLAKERNLPFCDNQLRLVEYKEGYFSTLGWAYGSGEHCYLQVIGDKTIYKVPPEFQTKMLEPAQAEFRILLNDFLAILILEQHPEKEIVPKKVSWKVAYEEIESFPGLFPSWETLIEIIQQAYWKKKLPDSYSKRAANKNPYAT